MIKTKIGRNGITEELELMITNNPETNREIKKIKVKEKPKIKKKVIRCDEAVNCVWAEKIGKEKYYCPVIGCLRR
jgi:hypothetical protein